MCYSYSSGAMAPTKLATMPQEARQDVLFVRVDQETKAKIEAAAEAEDLRVAQLLRRIIREWLQRREAEAARP
jgi:hypothetical protein